MNTSISRVMWEADRDYFVALMATQSYLKSFTSIYFYLFLRKWAKENGCEHIQHDVLECSEEEYIMFRLQGIAGRTVKMGFPDETV